MAVPFDKNFDVEIEQPAKRFDPSTAVYVRVRSGEISPHKTVSRKQDLLPSVAHADVVMTVPRSRKRLQVADTAADNTKWLLQPGARPDRELAAPRQAQGYRPTLCACSADG